MPAQSRAKPWRQHQNIAEKPGQVAVMVQKRENLHACRKAFDKPGKGGEGGVRIGGLGEMRQHWRDESAKKSPRPLTAGGGDAACRPARQNGGDIVRP